MPHVTIYTTGTCLMCNQTKMLLTKWKIPYREVRVDEDREGLRELMDISNKSRYVPQMAIDGEWIGGFNELTELHMEGRLSHLVEK